MNLTNEIEVFIEQTGNILRDAALPFYRKKRYFPVDAKALSENAIYATALYLRFRQITPRSEILGPLFLEEPSIRRVMEAWEESGNDFNAWLSYYCSHIDRVLYYRASAKTDMPIIWLPDTSAYRNRIEKLLKKNSMETENSSKN